MVSFSSTMDWYLEYANSKADTKMRMKTMEHHMTGCENKGTKIR